MFTNRLFHLLLLAIIVITGCAPQAAVTPKTTSQNEPITLRLAVADEQGRTSEPYVLEFIKQVKSLSNGNITVEPIWDAGANTTPVFEQGVVKVVKEGQYDLGLAGSRAWDSSGVTSFQALQTPFLITNDALAEAVASSDIATQMFDDLSSHEVAGLALWPEDLRHPFSVVPDKPILSPDDFKGMVVRAVPSEVTYKLIEALGGSPIYGDSEYQGAESGLRQGFSLTGTPTATGNVIFFAKYQVLFANGAEFGKLSEEQRTVVRQAAAEVEKKAITEHPGEGEAASAWCADGGKIVMASDDQVAVFEMAAQPVLDSLEQDPLTAKLIAAIRDLKVKIEPSAGAQACAPEGTQASPEPNTEAQVWSQGLPPNGTWQADLTTDDFVRMGLLRSVAQNEWASLYTLTFKDGKYLMVGQNAQGQSGKCQANYETVGDIVRLTYFSDADECEGEIDDIQWRIDDDGLHLHLVAIKNAGFTEMKALFEAKPWQKIADQ